MKAIIFDCDGVLVDSEVLYQEIQYQAVLDLGLFYEKNAYISRFMGSGEDNFYGAIARDYEAKFDKPLYQEFRTDLVEKLHSEFKTRLHVIQGTADLVQSITGAKAVASSSHMEFLHQKLKWTGLHSLFGEHIYSAEQVGKGKPAPDLFLFTAKKLEISPKECIVIEDSENGVKAGLSAGMHTIGFCGGGHCDEEHVEKLKIAGAHDVAMNIKELTQLLFSL